MSYQCRAQILHIFTACKNEQLPMNFWLTTHLGSLSNIHSL